jgi:hypothetical protein
MERTIIILLASLTLSACTNLRTLEDTPSPSAVEMAVSDTVITHWAIERGLGYEANPYGLSCYYTNKESSTVQDIYYREL